MCIVSQNIITELRGLDFEPIRTTLGLVIGIIWDRFSFGIWYMSLEYTNLLGAKKPLFGIYIFNWHRQKGGGLTGVDIPPKISKEVSINPFMNSI